MLLFFRQQPQSIKAVNHRPTATVMKLIRIVPKFVFAIVLSKFQSTSVSSIGQNAGKRFSGLSFLSAIEYSTICFEILPYRYSNTKPMNWQKHQTGFVPCRRKRARHKILYTYFIISSFMVLQVLNSSEINFNLLCDFPLKLIWHPQNGFQSPNRSNWSYKT
jgi:hypothetical protein